MSETSDTTRARLLELKSSARTLRDRRDIDALRKAVAEVRGLEGDSAWVRQHAAFCDAVEAVKRDAVDMRTALDLAPPLKDAFEFALAAKLLEVAWDAVRAASPLEPLDVRRVGHELALCVYKDEERVPMPRLKRALEVLEQVGSSVGQDAETMRLTGAVYKRRWEIGGAVEDLLSAHAAYQSAWERDPEEDAGYGAVNAAFLCDALAAAERERARRLGAAPAGGEPGAGFEREARALREAVKALLLARRAQGFWHLVTLAEAHFGLGEYAAAGPLLGQARGLPDASEWRVQSTTRQLASLFAHQCAGREAGDVEFEADAMNALAQLSGIGISEALTVARGKVGLALSGGGLRASLYHLGVLARLAEMDVLRHVEAISTVSGGSIVGAHYYLKLKEQLEKKAELAPGDYVALVDRLIGEFMVGVRANIRMRTLSNLFANLRMLFGKSVTRSTRLGELYDRYFYRRQGRLAGAGGAGPIRMSELLIAPKGFAEGFNPKLSNWRLANKVPVLLLNATSLNTGHSWQFTARWMGEPPAIVGKEIDCKPRYRRLYYPQAPEGKLREFALGQAVAASAGVPGLFDPIVVDGLYEERTVRLVDGGVHDNQGIEALLAEGCNFVICSDASGQMGETRDPNGGTLGVLLRSNTVLMDRVREVEYVDLDARKENRALTGFVFLHLKKDIEAGNLDWLRCQDPTRQKPPKPLQYGIDRKLQEQLADLRTDLDAFTDEEAAALMASGYLMTEHQFRIEAGGRERWAGFNVGSARRNWPFLRPEWLQKLAAAPQASPERTQLGKRLGVGSGLFFKVLRVDPLSMVLAILLAGIAAWLVWDKLSDYTLAEKLTVRDAVIALGLLALGMAMPMLNWVRPDSLVRRSVVLSVVAVLGWIVCNGYLLLFNRRYLAAGRIPGFYEEPPRDVDTDDLQIGVRPPG